MPKKTPQRMCLGCQERKDKRDLVRIVRSPDGGISVDPTGKKLAEGLISAMTRLVWLKLSKVNAWSVA